jgi:hypothetical protein
VARVPVIDRERLGQIIASLRLARARAGAALKHHLGGWTTVRALSVVVIPVALAPWLFAQIGKELASPLFRDSMMCQYTGWCIRHGMKLYRDVGAPDGPFIHFLHATMQLFVGITDQGCRRADLFIHVVGSGLMGAVLAPRFAETRIGAGLQRVAWALLAVALWLAWYVSQGWSQTVQRDGYYSLLGYLGLVLAYASADFSPRGARVAAFFGGALAMLMVFTRQSGIIYPACALLALLLADDPARERREARLKAALAGAGASLLLLLVLLLLFGSISGMRFWYFRYPFTFHRWLAKHNAFGLLTEEYTAAGLLSVVALVGVLAAAATRMVPLRAAAFAFPPFLFLIAACIVGKGWANHVQQVTAAQIPLELLVLSHIWNFDLEAPKWRPAHAAVAVLALLFIAYRTNQTLNESPYYKMPQPQPVEAEITQAHQLGQYLKAHTTPDDKVFFYAHELHILLDAERRTASPFFQNGLVNSWGFYQGAPAAPDAAPSPKELAAIRRLQDDINADTCPRLTGNPPPGAFILLDNAGNIFHNAVAEVIELCPGVGPLLKEKYEQPALPQFPGYHVFLRKKP